MNFEEKIQRKIKKVEDGLWKEQEKNEKIYLEFEEKLRREE